VGVYYAVRGGDERVAIASRVREIVRQLDSQAAVYNAAPMEQLVSNSLARPRVYAVLVGLFALIAAALAVVGLYGVIAYSVVQRTREIGIRIALGARRGEVTKLVMGKAMAWTATGIVLGLAGASATTRYLESMLFGLTPLDSASFLGVTLLFITVAVLAAYVPTRRATQVDPLVALRDE
jgi:ABC-type antimicrobial peptide transport system permease subunit